MKKEIDMSKTYKVIITKEWINGEGRDFLGAFTCEEALDKPYKNGMTYAEVLTKVYKEWDINIVMDYPIEWIKSDYNIEDFDLFMHD